MTLAIAFPYDLDEITGGTTAVSLRCAVAFPACVVIRRQTVNDNPLKRSTVLNPQCIAHNRPHI